MKVIKHSSSTGVADTDHYKKVFGQIRPPDQTLQSPLTSGGSSSTIGGENSQPPTNRDVILDRR